MYLGTWQPALQVRARYEQYRDSTLDLAHFCETSCRLVKYLTLLPAYVLLHPCAYPGTAVHQRPVTRTSGADYHHSASGGPDDYRQATTP